MITMKCCNNSEHIRFENLLKEGCEYKSKKKKLISDFQINTCKINEIQLGFVVRRFQRQTLSNVWPNIDFPREVGLDAQHGDHIQQNQLHINALGDHHKSTQPDWKKIHDSRWLLSITCTRVTVDDSSQLDHYLASLAKLAI